MNNILIKKEISKRTDEIIKLVEKFAHINGINKAFSNKIGDKKIGRTQLASLLANSKNASSTDEIKLFIEYKKSRKNGWDMLFNNRSVADHLIDTIREVEKIAMDIKEVAVSEYKESFAENDIRVLKLMVVEKFLGYLYWRGSVMANNGRGNDV